MALPRRQFLSTAGAAAVGSLSMKSSGISAEAQQPNVVYVFSDQHRWHSMSFTGMPELKTPNMARLAGEGISFDNCISNYSVCSPHRAILMTGRWPYYMKMKDDSPGMIDNNRPLSPDQMTIGKVFQNAGYRTGYIGKWHLGGNQAEPFGFHHSILWSGTNNHWESSYTPPNGKRVVSKRYNATHMTDQAMDFITQSQSDPFFLMLSLNPPHSDFTDPPEDKRALYPGESSLSHRGNFVPGVRDGKYEGDWPKYQGYHAHVSAIDDELGRIMQQLDALGLADNTILVYSSDHGSMCGSHGLGNKRHPYEESIKTPFIVRWPKAMPAGQTTDSLFGTIDIMPSLCALAGLAIPDECQGQNFSPTMLGQTGPSPESQFLMHIYFKKAEERESSDAPYFRGVITDRYTYTVRKKGPWQLFDNLKDPYQLNNLIDDPGLSAERSKMKNMVAAWLQQAGDPFVLPGD